MALDGGEDGLAFYHRLAAETPEYLNEGGSLLLEIGDEQARSVTALLAETGAYDEICVHRDLYKLERVVTARRRASAPL